MDNDNTLCEIASLKYRVAQLTETLTVLHHHAISSAETIGLLLAREGNLVDFVHSISVELNNIREQVEAMREDADAVVVPSCPAEEFEKFVQ